MSVYIDQQQAVIGMFYANLSCISIKRSRCIFIGQIAEIIIFFCCSFFVLILLLKHGDIGINPGPKKKLSKYFSCCQWNLNSILAHNKLSLLVALWNEVIRTISSLFIFLQKDFAHKKRTTTQNKWLSPS